MFSNQALETMLVELIDKRIKNTLKDKGLEVPYDGTVESIEDSEGNINPDITDPYSQFANVSVTGYNTTVRLRNLSGEILTDGSKVRIYTNNGNLANGYIGIKCK